MNEENKKTLAALSVVFAALGIFVAWIICEPLALVFGIIGAQSKEQGYKIAGIVGAIASGAMLMYMLFMTMTIVSYLK